jgi:hypothetical protein
MPKLPHLIRALLLSLLALAGATLAAPADEEEELLEDEDLVETEIVIDETLHTTTWNKVRFDQRFLTYSPAQVKAQWDLLNRGLLAEYPSAEYLRKRFEAFPELKGMTPKFTGDYQKLSDEIIQIWILFYRGDFQEARQRSNGYGPFAAIPGMFAQIIYAIYLADTQKTKHALLTEVGRRIDEYDSIINKMKGQKKTYARDYVIYQLGNAYATARVAEEAPIPIVLKRGYIGDIKGACDEILGTMPDHPLGLAFRAGVDAGIMRRVGKAAGRMTYGAKQSVATDYFEKSIARVPDMAITHYEHGNAIIYINKKRNLDKALQEIEVASKMRPHFAMEALDAMYASKRFKEIRDFLTTNKSFRSFERARRAQQRKTGENLTNVYLPPFLLSKAE